MQFPTKRYTVIYADPPWQYRDQCNAGQRGAVHKYPVLPLSALRSLPVPQIADPRGCALFLWSTGPLLPEALLVMGGWGFDYRTVAFTWAKTTRSSGTWVFGMGHWTRANAEFCLLGIYGPNPPRQSAAVRSLVVSTVREHSRKPDCVRTRIVDLMGDVPRIELFARQQTPGWDTWGLEMERFQVQDGAEGER